MNRLKGKIAIICGCSGGIGGSTVRRLAAEGATVAIADFDAAFATGLADEITEAGGQALGIGVDLADEASVDALYAAVLERFGGFDILHNNAAETTPSIMNRDIAIQDMDVALWDRSFRINARGTMLMVRGALPTLLARGGGSIINTSSGATLLGDLFLPAYAASKSAVVTLTKYVAAQYGKDNIRCNAVSPGLIITQGAQHVAGRFDVYKRHTLLPELGEPDDIAAMVALLASDDGKFITGQVIAVDGGITSHFPHFADTLPGFKEAAAAQRAGS